ncbi:PAS domain S-box protein [Sideroxydans sp. CL21]|uniref:sensor domain-containing protein n=1 Tax=Sideroxydans sp. CL21 TaxID=2600596 RepID=UPI0024BC377F|nr:PAS domain S-box protein [Sideroxydans sp. CL21]
MLYAAFAALWILASDRLLALSLPDQEMVLWIGLIKGLFFVAATALLLFLLMRKLLIQATDKDKQLKLFHDLPFIGMAISSPDSKEWLYTNDRLCDMLGYTRAELQQTTWADITHPDDLDSNVDQFERMKAGEIDGYTLEKRFIRKDGSPINATINVKCTRGRDGKANYIVALIDDITQRKRAELALRKSEATYRSLFDNMLNGVSHSRMIYRDGIPVDFEFIAVNPAFEAATGLKNVVGRKMSEIIPGYGEDNPESLETFDRVAKNGEATRWEHYLAAVGKWFSFSIYCPAPGEFIAVTEDITERKQAELALRKNEATYRSLFDNMLNGLAHYRMIFHDGIPVDYEFIAVNPAFELTTGLKNVVGKKVSEVIPGYAEANPDSLQIFGKVARTGEPTRWEHYLAALDKWFSFSIYSPAPGEFVVVHDDITERKRAEEALSESEDRLRNIFNSAVDGILLADAVTRKFVMSNPAIQHMLGYSAEEILQLGVDNIHLAEDLSEVLTDFDRHLVGEKHSTHNVSVKRKDGSVFYADISASPITINGKRCLMGTFRDITERKQNEDALRQAATVFQNSHNGIIITDLQGNIVAVNQSFVQHTDYAEAELLGKNPRILHSGRQGRDFYRKMWTNILEAGFWQGEVWNRRKNGEVYPTWLAISAVRNDQGVTTHYVGISSDLSQLKQSEAEREHLAHFDPLTDLPNRLLLQSHLTHALAQAQRHRTQLGVLYIDLDRFKNINDSMGYLVGDELLVNLTERLTMHMRSEDMLARLGGDEFLLVLEHINSPEDTAVVARSLLELLSQSFALPGGQEIFIGASIGISIFPSDGSNAEQMIQHADAAMHQAKKQGRNTYRFYTDALTRAAGEHLELENRLRHAIGANQLRVYFQPQVDIVTGHIVGAEALVRWQDPERGLIPPAHFIRLAEETGLIGAIGEWVLRETCLQGARWIEAGLPFLTLAVNLSPHQFMRGNIAELVSKVLAETGFPADRLELELTESALMEQEEDAVKMLHLLRAQDIRLAIDDFGTGYSSLSYLKRFPLDILKIDKSFIDDIPFHQDDMEIATTIIAMGHILGFKVLAEGVETAEQLAFLQDKGCDMYQGYLTSPPVPAEDFEKLLVERTQKVK